MSNTDPLPLAPAAEFLQLDIAISGMTCSSCSSRVQRKLSKLPGVQAAVNFATDSAQVSYDPAQVTVEQLLDTIVAAGYTPELPAQDGGAAAGASDGPSAQARDLRTRLLVAVIAGVPVSLLSMVPSLQFDYWQWLCLALSLPVYGYAGWPFHRATWRNLRHGAFTMDTLISLGTTAALLWTIVALLWGGAGHPGMRMGFSLRATGSHHAVYFDAVTMVIMFLLLGRLLEEQAKYRSSAALRALLQLGSRSVRLSDGRVLDISLLRPGMEFQVAPGESIATDARVLSGRSEVDESMLTGESLPVTKAPGAQVTGGTLNLSGALVLRAERVGAETTLARLTALVQQAQASRAPVQRLVDRIAQYFVPTVIGIALLTLGGHLWLGHPPATAFSAMVAVLVVACPCALGLATPTALLVGTGRGAQLGLVIKGQEVLEATRTVDTVLLDKTGTLTTGQMQVRAAGTPELLALAAQIEAHSQHPVAQAIARAIQLPAGAVEFLPELLGAQPVPAAALGEVGQADAELIQVREVPGQGVTAQLPAAGLQVQVVRPQQQPPAHPVLAGTTVVEVRWRQADAGAEELWHSAGWIAVADTLKPTSAQAVQELRALGLRPVLLTGDRLEAAQPLAQELGIAEVHAGVHPDQKVAVVAALQAAGHQVAMVGDGINDAAALARADLGLAMASGTDVAMEAADITVMNSDLRSVATAIRLARATVRTIRANLGWAFGYNLVLIPVAAAGLLNPMFAGAAMAFSSVFVVGNSLRLRRVRANWAG